MVRISRQPRTVKEYDEIIQDYWEVVIPKYRVKDTGPLIQFDISAWANSELEIFRFGEKGLVHGPGGKYTSIHLKLEPNRWMVIFRKGIEDTDLNEIFIFYVLDIESRKGGYETIWMTPPKSLRGQLRGGKIFPDWGPIGWAANADTEWAYLDVAKDTGGFINWPFENPLSKWGDA